jgi:hypothetical protein
MLVVAGSKPVRPLQLHIAIWLPRAALASGGGETTPTSSEQ